MTAYQRLRMDVLLHRDAVRRKQLAQTRYQLYCERTIGSEQWALAYGLPVLERFDPSVALAIFEETGQ